MKQIDSIMKHISKDAVVYPNSVVELEKSTLWMIEENQSDFLVVTGELVSKFEGETFKIEDLEYIQAPLTHKNALSLREYVKYTKPIPVLRKKRSFGLGDRLGIAGVGHLRLFKEYDAYPVLCQQSIRELELTNRTYEDVLDAASFAVFKEGYKDGFGADGDHLKTPEDIEYALRLGFTMITLDCSDHINNDVMHMSDDEVLKEVTLNDYYTENYLNKSFKVEDHIVAFSEIDLKRIVLTYEKAIEYANKIYHTYLKDLDTTDFEISIDETFTPTTPAQHYFVATELIRGDVIVDTLAPRFCGEFQKGVDYIGDIAQFEKELSVHAAIARNFDYKLSIHSGSDKFSIFELIGKYTNGLFHVKTAGTNWLEAIKVIAITEPKLYRELHEFALKRFPDALKYYHVTTDINKIPDIDTLNDDELPKLFTMNDARQLIHITYGFILTEKDQDGNYIFKDRLYQIWKREEEQYANELYQHIGRHLTLLYKGFE